MKRSPSNQFIQYLASVPHADSLDSLQKISSRLKISLARLREQLEVAKALGMVEIRPRNGMKRLPYRFMPAVRQSLAYSIQLDPSNFNRYTDLRNHIEAAYWDEAVRHLTQEDIAALDELVVQAWKKLRGNPVQIPHSEHRELHLLLYRRLGNPYVTGILEAFWDAYETVGLNLYADYLYLEEVWDYHQKMVDSIRNGDYQAGYQALLEHKDLLHFRPSGTTGVEKADPILEREQPTE